LRAAKKTFSCVAFAPDRPIAALLRW